MAEPFLAEIRLMSFGFAPRGWATCDGQLLPINQNQALFALCGTTYGGNGQTNFALPDLRGRVPMHMGAGHTQGERSGEQAHTLTIAELPTHTHVETAAATPATTGTPGTSTHLAASKGANLYGAATNLIAFDSASNEVIGGSQAHPNLQPFLTLNFCIALQGIFPSPN